MEAISERVKQIVDYKEISVKRFERKIGTGNNSISMGIKNKSNLSGNILIKILNSYSDINPVWLLTGKGKMLKKVVKKSFFSTKDRENLVDELSSSYALKTSTSKDETIASLKLNLESQKETIALLKEKIALLKKEKL